MTLFTDAHCTLCGSKVRSYNGYTACCEAYYCLYGDDDECTLCSQPKLSSLRNYKHTGGKVLA